MLPEADSEAATAVRTVDDELIAPSLVYAEIGSAIVRAVLRGDVSAAEARSQLQIAVAHYRRSIPLEQLAGRAIELASRLRHPIYDCFYLALAERKARRWSPRTKPCSRQPAKRRSKCGACKLIPLSVPGEGDRERSKRSDEGLWRA